jgi:glycerol-1-phosphate dehydrogenase [NAD(P)+]
MIPKHRTISSARSERRREESSGIIIMDVMQSYYNNEIDIGRGVVRRLAGLMKGKAAIIADKTSYALMRRTLRRVPHRAYLLGGGHLPNLREIGRKKYDTYLGMGGGTAIDIAKYFGYAKHKPVIAVPTILSTNAFTTVKVCAKEVLRHVRAVGSTDAKIPDVTLIDLDILRRARKRYNRAGAGDILSIYVADWEWRIPAHKRKRLPGFHFKADPYDPVIAGVALSLLDALRQSASEIKNATEKGLAALAKMLIYSGYVTNMYGSGRPESGAEHLFASAVVNTFPERRFLHGELVSLGTLIMTYLEGRRAAPIATLIQEIGLPLSLTSIGLTVYETIQAISTAKYERRDRYTTLHHRNVGFKESRRVVNFLISHKYLTM